MVRKSQLPLQKQRIQFIQDHRVKKFSSLGKLNANSTSDNFNVQCQVTSLLKSTDTETQHRNMNHTLVRSALLSVGSSQTQAELHLQMTCLPYQKPRVSPSGLP